uniref:Uncharacterized protein n=1 Tax=Timema douglasi TaxID=61478 RepID=A0A7R8VJ33_TIMDO|nr:unnamed protein product [Timema douglasi]
MLEFQKISTVAYDTVRPLAYQDARVFLLCFRVSDPDSLDNAVNKKWVKVRFWQLSRVSTAEDRSDPVGYNSGLLCEEGESIATQTTTLKSNSIAGTARATVLSLPGSPAFLPKRTTVKHHIAGTVKCTWYPEIRQHCDNTPVILCGCQSDMRNDIETISSLAKMRRIPVTSEQAVTVSRTVGATTYVETSAKTSGKAVRDAFEVAALAALGKLNKNHAALQRQKAYTHHGGSGGGKSKLDLKAELKDRAKSCCLM